MPAFLWIRSLGQNLLRGSWLALLALTILACAVSSDLPLPEPSAAVQPTLPSEEWIEVFFTDPRSVNADTYRGGPDQRLADAIQGARVSVDLAVLDLDLWSIRDALLAAHRRGIAVRLVVESDYLDTHEIQDLKDAGIPLLGDRHQGLMHNKFVIIDRSEVWTGSMNYTIRDGYRNNNNLLHIRSSRLAGNYTNEFEEMFVDDRFGKGSPPNTPDPQLDINGTAIETYFAPEDAVAARLLELISEARQSVYFLAFSFTADDLAHALRQRAASGVLVRGVMETSQVASNTGGEFENFRAAGLDVHLDGNPANMHHKILVIDGKIIVVGSYNFSRSADETNDENLLVIHSEQVADLFLAEFQRVYADALANE